MDKCFILGLWYQQRCNVIVKITNIKSGLLSKHSSQKTQQHSDGTKPLGNEKFVKKTIAFQLSHEIKNIRRSKLYQ